MKSISLVRLARWQPTLLYRLSARLQSDFSTQNEVQDEEIVVSKQPQLPQVPLTSLNINPIKVKKTGSFSVELFTGNYDHDYLIYPEPLDNRKENEQLKEQVAMVKQLYPKIWDDESQLQRFNFHNMFQLSVTEMMTIFEAIGASTEDCYQSKQLAIQGESIDLQKLQTQVTKSAVSLIIRNCLTYWPIHKSDNKFAKTLIPENHILFGGSADLQTKPCLPIGFCWTEQAPSLGSLPPQEWKTTLQTGGADVQHSVINGQKTNVFLDESTEHYLVFYRDKFLAEKHDTDNLGFEPNPASDPFAGCCLVHKSELDFSQVYFDSSGLQYVDVRMDTLIPSDRIIFPSRRKDPKALNIKALGQLATCSVTMGLLKSALTRTYQYLLNYKSGLLTCDIIEKKLATVTSKIFAIESMLYYIAGIYDGLEEGFDAHLEATILKVITYDYAYQIIQDLQQVNGSEMLKTSKLQDQVNIFDSFLDGNIYNRLYLATMGVIYFARSKNVHLNQLRLAPWNLGYYSKNLFKEMSERGDWMTIHADIHGHLHPSLETAGTNLEYIIKRINYATENICRKYGDDVTGAQGALYRLSQLTIDAFMLTTLCARASKSYCNGSKNCDIDLALTINFSNDLVRKVRIYIEEINKSPIEVIEYRARTINELNLKNGGYYAESPLDPNI